MSRLIVKVVPNAKKSEMLGWEDEPIVGRVWRVRVAAPATEGKANKAVVEFVARSLGVSKSSVRLQKGDTSRLKHLEIDLEGNELISRLGLSLSKK